MLRAIGRVLYVLAGIVFWGADGVYHRIAPWAPAYLWSLAITAGLWLALIPTFVVVKVLTGWAPAAYFAAFLAALLSAVLGALGTPIGILIGLLTGKGREAGTWYVRLVGAILFFELVGSLYLLTIPLHQNLGAVPLLILAGITAILGSVLYRVGAFRPAFFVWVAIAIVILATLSFVFPATFGVIAAQGGQADAGFAGKIIAQPMRLLLWGAGLLILAAYVAARALDKPWLKAAAWGLVLLVLALAVVDWLAWGSGLAGPAMARPSPAVVPGFPLKYASPHQVAGSLAPRPGGPTRVVERASVWEASIDGSNEFRHREPADGHRTGITVPPGQAAAVSHRSGTITYNTHGDRVDLCGTRRTVYDWEKFRFPVGIYGVWVGLVTPDGRWDFAAWQCGREELRIRNRFDAGAEVVLYFNTNSVYKTPDGQTHTDGFAYAGWDGERAEFAVRLLPAGSATRESSLSS